MNEKNKEEEGNIERPKKKMRQNEPEENLPKQQQQQQQQILSDSQNDSKDNNTTNNHNNNSKNNNEVVDLINDSDGDGETTTTNNGEVTNITLKAPNNNTTSFQGVPVFVGSGSITSNQQAGNLSAPILNQDPPDVDDTLDELHPDAKADMLVDALETFGVDLILSNEEAVNSLLQIAANMNPHWFELLAAGFLASEDDEEGDPGYINANQSSSFQPPPLYHNQQLPRGPTTGPGVTADDPVDLLDSDDDDTNNNNNNNVVEQGMHTSIAPC